MVLRSWNCRSSVLTQIFCCSSMVKICATYTKKVHSRGGSLCFSYTGGSCNRPSSLWDRQAQGNVRISLWYCHAFYHYAIPRINHHILHKRCTNFVQGNHCSSGNHSHSSSSSSFCPPLPVRPPQMPDPSEPTPLPGSLLALLVEP